MISQLYTNWYATCLFFLQFELGITQSNRPPIQIERPAITMIKRTPSQLFPSKISPAWAARIDPDDPNDPLLLQVQPSVLEDKDDSTLSHDPVGDLAAMRIPGVLQKYPGRVLINLWNECPIHCRFCFRRNLSPSQFAHLGDNIAPLIHLLDSDPTIHEVIFSGGDPLMAEPSLIRQAIQAISDLPSVRRLRFHTRVPIARPERIDAPLLRLFHNQSLPICWVLHTNHPREIDTPVQKILAAVRQTPVQLLSQTVLLKGVNNDPATLRSLFELAYAHGILPYYLHIPDRAAGTGHFQVTLREARAIFAELQSTLPGYLVPRLVQERTGHSCKTLIVPESETI